VAQCKMRRWWVQKFDRRKSLPGWAVSPIDSAAGSFSSNRLKIGSFSHPTLGCAAPYPTLLASNGARHEVIGPRIGALVDAEPDGQPTSSANGDDTHGVDDEDASRSARCV